MNTSARYATLITVQQLHSLQASGAPLRIFDTSFDLMNPAAGAQQYAQGHIPGAQYAHLDHDLSAKGGAATNVGAVSAAGPLPRREGPLGGQDVRAATDVGANTPASGGRHPLPSRESFSRWLGSQGVSHDTQVVVYDRQGVNYCGRLWWMLKWVGHDAVAVLDGGWQAWQAAGLAVAQGAPQPPTPAPYALREPLLPLVSSSTVARQLGRPSQTLIDARAPARYRGETEPLDPVAGHIPGALNRPFASNLDSTGCFKPAPQLRAEFEQLLAGRDPASVVHHCGSGVSAVPNILAMCIAGLGPTGLYAGSWSEWCSDPSRPVAQG